MDCFDSDVLIYAVAPDHHLGSRVRRLFEAATGHRVGIGSLMLLPETLIKPKRTGIEREVSGLLQLLAQLDLRPVDATVADAAVYLGARYGLRAVDAVHVATAVVAGADRFITNNRRDFPQSIVEVDVTYPDDLPAVNR